MKVAMRPMLLVPSAVKSGYLLLTPMTSGDGYVYVCVCMLFTSLCNQHKGGGIAGGPMGVRTAYIQMQTHSACVCT